MLLLIVLMTASFFFSADAQVEKCKTCNNDTSDASACAKGDNLESINCNNPDRDNTFCQVTRSAGVWERGCCIGINNCTDVHTTDMDGGTTDVVNCHSDDCNIMDPRTQNAVETCIKCNGTDGTDCAKGDSFNGQICHNGDLNTWCRVRRAGGVWTRDCCFGANNCKDVHSKEDDGSTTDVINCHTNNCNIMDPRTQNADDGVETCIKCSGTDDGTDCAKGDQLRSETCGNADFDNTWCRVRRAGGVWTRDCCEGVNNCTDKHSTENDGSTTDVIHCQTNDCNIMDPRTQNADDGVETCIKCSGTDDGTPCAKGDSFNGQNCGNADFDNTYCQVKRAGGVWTRGCCVGVNKCKDVHSTDNTGSTTDIINCRTNDCNDMDPRTNTTATTPTGSGGSPSYMLTVVMMLCFLTYNI